MNYVNAANLGRRVNYMNLSTSKTSFVSGRAMRAVVRVVQDGETTTREHVSCLDSGSDVNLARRYLLHDVRRIDTVIFNFVTTRFFSIGKKQYNPHVLMSHC